MKKETIQVILTLLNRVQLSGGEVPAFNKVIEELHQELIKPEVVN